MKKSRCAANPYWGQLPIILFMFLDVFVDYRFALLSALVSFLSLLFIVIRFHHKGISLLSLCLSIVLLHIFAFHYYILPSDFAISILPLSAELILILIYLQLMYKRMFIYRLIIKYFETSYKQRFGRSLHLFFSMAYFSTIVFITHLFLSFILILMLKDIQKIYPLVRISGFVAVGIAFIISLIKVRATNRPEKHFSELLFIGE